MRPNKRCSGLGTVAPQQPLAAELWVRRFDAISNNINGDIFSVGKEKVKK